MVVGGRLWALLAGALLVLLAPSSARAEPSGQQGYVQPRRSGCDVIHSLSTLGRDQRELLLKACADGPKADAATYAAIFRLVSSSSWHAGVVGTILRRHGKSSLTAWADGGSHGEPPALAAQEKIEAALPEFSAGRACTDLRESEAMLEFLDAVAADDEPTELPFTSRFASCLGVPLTQMEGNRLLTVRADGLEDVTVVMGTRDFVHARRFERAEALQLGSHRFFVVAVPEASPVAVFANHENQELPVAWRGLMGRNTVIWTPPPRRSCLDMSVLMNAGTHLYIDGVRVDGGPPEDVCARPVAEGAADVKVDRTVAVTLDHRGSGLPDHEVAALVCENGTPVVRHLSAVAATAPSDQLRRSGECDTLRLDLGTPDRQRVALLGVTKLPGCEATPLWASDVQERVRHVLRADLAHSQERDYANFSAYAEASEALASLESRMGRPDGDDSAPDRGADTNALLGSAAQEAWRQGIDTLLSFAVQCTPRGEGPRGETRWAYSIRGTAIQVSELFARGYYSRDGIDLEDFIDVESVGFGAADEQDAAIGALLDRVFEVPTARFTHAPVEAPYQQRRSLRISTYVGSGEAVASADETRTIHYKPFARLGRGKPVGEPERPTEGPPTPDQVERPRLCEALVYRGARSKEVVAQAAERFEKLPSTRKDEDGRSLVLRRSRDEIDVSSNPRALVYQGDVLPPRPGWYLVTVEGSDGEIEDAVCIHATAHSIDLWADLMVSGGPLAFFPEDSRSDVYVRPRLGMTRYFRQRWLGLGGSVAYGYTRYTGTRADWTDLEVSQQDRLQWQRHALLIGPHVEFRSRSTRLPVEPRARFGVIGDAGLQAIGGVSPDLVDFRAGNVEDVVLDFDLDLNLELGIGVPLGRIQLMQMVTLTYAGVDDSLRRTATTVTQDANLYVGFGLGIAGGRR